MGLFSRLFKLFKEKDPHQDLETAYSTLNEIGQNLKIELALLHQELEKVVPKSEDPELLPLPLQKTRSIVEEFVPKLETLVEKTEDRFNKVLAKGDFSLEEEQEIQDVLHFLKKVEGEIQIGNLSALSSAQKRRVLYDKLRKVDDIAQDFHFQKKYHGIVTQPVIFNKVEKLLIWKVFNESYKSTDVPVTQKQFEQVYAESEIINASVNPNWRIKWRNWWQDPPQWEKDFSHPKKHINVTM